MTKEGARVEGAREEGAREEGAREEGRRTEARERGTNCVLDAAGWGVRVFGCACVCVCARAAHVKSWPIRVSSSVADSPLEKKLPPPPQPPPPPPPPHQAPCKAIGAV